MLFSLAYCQSSLGEISTYLVCPNMSEKERKVHVDDASCIYCASLKNHLVPLCLCSCEQFACFHPVNVSSLERTGSTSLTVQFCKLLAAW